MRQLLFLSLLLQMGCTQQIKVRIPIYDTGAGGFPDFDDDDEFEPSNEPSGDPGPDPEPTNEPTNEPSGDPNGGDPNGGTPVGEPGGNPEPSQEAGAEPGGEPGDGGGGAGVFDACDAAVYCILAGEDTTAFNNYFNEQQSCTSAAGDATYDAWFTCVADAKGDPCSGAGGGNWGGCDCAAVQTCTDENTNPIQ